MDVNCCVQSDAVIDRFRSICVFGKLPFEPASRKSGKPLIRAGAQVYEKRLFGQVTRTAFIRTNSLKGAQVGVNERVGLIVAS